MGVREKLIELLCNLPTPEFVIGTRRAGKKLITAGFIADHLIANGVTTQEWISVKNGVPESGKEGVLIALRWEKLISVGVKMADGEANL